MTGIQQKATLTSKGQITLPVAIRQSLGLDSGDSLLFELRGDEVIMSRARSEHHDPAIGAFLHLLEQDIRSGRHLASLPEDLAGAMLAKLDQPVNLDEDIEGQVSL